MKTEYQSSLLHSGVRWGRVLCLAGVMSLSAAGLLPAATVTWDADLTTPGAQDGDGIWSASSGNFWNGTIDMTPVKGTDNMFIGSTTGGFTVTIDAGGGTLNFADATSNSGLTFNQNYTLAGATAADTLAMGNVTVAAGKTATISVQINGGGINKTWSVNNGSTLVLSGGGVLQNFSAAANTEGTIHIAGGTWGMNGPGWGPNGANGKLNVVQSAGSITGNANTNLNLGASSGATGTGTTSYTITGGSLAMGANGSINIGNSNSTAGVANTIMSVEGGTVTGTNLNVGAGTNGAAGNGTLNVSGGSITLGNNLVVGYRPNSAFATTAVANISGGTTSVKGVQFGQGATVWTAGSSSTLNMTGGVLYVGTNGMTKNATAPETVAVNLSGGTIGATGNWNSSMAMNLGTTNGNITFRTTDAVGATGYVITLNGVLSGEGGLTKDGVGTLQLFGANTFTGLTLVNAGVLATGATGTFGAGDILVATATLTLGNSASIGDDSLLTFNSLSTIVLGTGVTETIGALFNSTTGTYMTEGTYTAAQLNSFFGGDEFSGAGSLIVMAPEPSTYALLTVALCGLACTFRRKGRNS